MTGLINNRAKRPFARLLVSTLLISSSLSACATKPDPAVVCTSEWIKPRATSAIKEIKRDTKRALSALKKNGPKMAMGEKLNPLAAMSMMSALKQLADTFENGSGMRDLKTLATTCDDPAIIKDALFGFMDEVEAPKALKDMIEGFDYEAMIEQMKELEKR